MESREFDTINRRTLKNNGLSGVILTNKELKKKKEKKGTILHQWEVSTSTVSAGLSRRYGSRDHSQAKTHLPGPALEA